MNSIRRQVDQGDGTFREEIIEDTRSSYLELQRLAFIEKFRQRQESLNNLIKDGHGKSEAEDILNKALRSNRAVGDIAKKAKVAGAALKLGSRLALSTIWAWGPMLFLCFAVFLFATLTSAVIQEPTRFFNLECAKTAFGDTASAANCVRQGITQHTQNSMENQGLTI